MDSSGRVMLIEDNRVTYRTEKPIPNPRNATFVLKALDAAPAEGDWWPQMAPLTRKEREWVLANVKRPPVERVTGEGATGSPQGSTQEEED
jgi:hypothetical protein